MTRRAEEKTHHDKGRTTEPPFFFGHGQNRILYINPAAVFARIKVNGSSRGAVKSFPCGFFFTPFGVLERINVCQGAWGCDFVFRPNAHFSADSYS